MTWEARPLHGVIVNEFIQVGRSMLHTGSGRIHSFHLFWSSGFIEELADQTGLELFSMPWQLSTLSRVTSSFT